MIIRTVHFQLKYSREGFSAPASDEGKESGCEVSGGVDGIAAVKSETEADAKHHEPYAAGDHRLRDGHVARVGDGAHADYQNTRTQHL